MKSILITVGTTPFDSLIEYLDKNLSYEPQKVMIQISDKAKYLPQNYKYLTFIKNISEYYSKYDIIITHAGAGSIYQLLELGKKIIIVPNLERKDKHQSDIANYMHANKYAITCYSYQKIILCLKDFENISANLKPFLKNSFFADQEIIKVIKSEYDI